MLKEAICFEPSQDNRAWGPGSNITQGTKGHMHYGTKNYFQAPFWCFILKQIGNSSQFLERPNSTWKDHDRNIEVLPGTDWRPLFKAIFDNLKHQKRS